MQSKVRQINVKWNGIEHTHTHAVHKQLINQSGVMEKDGNMEKSIESSTIAGEIGGDARRRQKKTRKKLTRETHNDGK